MHGKHSLTASVVAIGGPDGPRYYPESFSETGAESLASSFRSFGVPAIAIPVHLRMPEPRRFLEQSAATPPQLFAVVRDDPFDLIEAEVLAAQEQQDEVREPSAGGGNRSLDDAEPEASDASDGAMDDEMEDAAEPLGDESTYLGGAMFERLLDQWTVWLAYVDHGFTPQLTSAFPTLDEAWKEAERWRDDPEYADWAAIIVGPGDGPITVDNITLWPDKWTLRTPNESESRCGGGEGPYDRDFAKQLADIYKNEGENAPVIIAAYRPAAKGGER